MRWIVRKELAIFFADRAGAFLTLIVPTLLAALVGMLFAAPDGTGLDLLVVDQDSSANSAFLIEQLRGTGVEIEIVDLEIARARVSAGERLAVVLPVGMGAALTPQALFAGSQAPAVTLMRDPARVVEGRMLRGAITQASMLTLLREGQHDRVPDVMAKVMRRISNGAVLPIEEALLGRNGSPANYHSYAHAFAGMICMFLLFAGQSAARRLVEERAEGTLYRLRLSAVSPHQQLLGVGIAAAIVALIASALAYLVGILFFGIPVYSPVGFAVMLIAQALCVGGFTLLLAGFGRTARQVDGIGTFAILVMSFAGGAWLPSFLMPDWLRTVALALPTRWTTDGLAAMTWRGEVLSVGLFDAGVLVAFGAVFAALGIWRFRWE